MTPAAELVAVAKAAGALVVVDGVHVAQHRAIDLSDIGADIVTVSPYKVFGPHMGLVAATPDGARGLGSVPGAPGAALRDHRSAGRPARRTTRRWRRSWPPSTTSPSSGPLYAEPADDTRRAAVLAAFDAIGAHERRLSRRFLDGIAGIDGVRLFGIGSTDRVGERTPTFALRVGDRHPRETSKELAGRGIFTWDGHYYAMELYDRLGLLESGGAVRVGFCHYHATDEVDRVLEALADLA